MLFILATVVQSHAQNLVQPLSVNLVAFDTVGNQTIRIGTQQFIRYLWGTNVPNGHLYLVTPAPNAPGTTDALGAFLRITSGTTTLYEIPSGTEFNLYQDVAVLRTNRDIIYTHALNRFSFDTGYVRAELQGISTWTIWLAPFKGVDVSGAGAFTSQVNGWADIYNGTHSIAPISGTIIGLRPVPGP